MEKYNIEKIWITDDAVWIRTADGREALEWANGADLAPEFLYEIGAEA